MTLTGILTTCAEVIMTSTSVVERSVNVTRPDDHTLATYDSLVFTIVPGSFTCTAIVWFQKISIPPPRKGFFI